MAIDVSIDLAVSQDLAVTCTLCHFVSRTINLPHLCLPMKTACLLLGLVAFVAACPDEWVNPCVIAGRGGELNARNRQWCGTSGAGYLGRLGYEVSGSYVSSCRS